MSGETTEVGSLPAEETVAPERIPITLRLTATAMVSGLVGMVVMLPVLVGIPVALNLFDTDPLLHFSSFVTVVGLQPSLEMGVVLFVVAGTVVLPLQFLVVGAFLPPADPRFARGVTFALFYWLGFMLAFWPGGTVVAMGLFVAVSFVYHVFYGATLGYLLDRWAEIPQHAV